MGILGAIDPYKHRTQSRKQLDNLWEDSFGVGLSVSTTVDVAGRPTKNLLKTQNENNKTKNTTDDEFLDTNSHTGGGGNWLTIGGRAGVPPPFSAGDLLYTDKEYYPNIAITALTRILWDRSLKTYHKTAMHVIGMVFRKFFYPVF